MKARVFASPHFWPLLFLITLCCALWADVLFGGRILLPGEMLRGFAPFGSDANAPWTILKWDALAQYTPWRMFAARELAAGRIPLWNPHQFSGAPFVANGQSAVFYPLNVPFWIFDVPRAFGIVACLHSLLAMCGAYFLCVRWQLSRVAALCGATAFGMSGYLISWSALPTLSETASWLPLLILLFERTTDEKTRSRYLQQLSLFAIALCCALLAGHAQIWAFLVIALALRALFLWRWRALQVLAGGVLWAICLSTLQLLPLLELARLGHRAGATASAQGWAQIQLNALQPFDLPSLIVPNWPQWSWSENFGYQGVVTLVLAFIAMGSGVKKLRALSWRSPKFFAMALTLCGLIYGMGLPPTSLAYFYIPGWAQLAGAGRALLWWNLGASLLAAFGIQALSQLLARSRPKDRRLVLSLILVCLVVELGFNAWNNRVTSARAEIYPQTALTSWLQKNLKSDERVAFITPREGWFPSEQWQANGRNHPPGVLPPNGAMVYGLSDVGGYDSLAPRAYRQFINEGEGRDVAPLYNGNIVLPAADNANFPALKVRYIVTLESQRAPGTEVWRGENVVVWRQELPNGKAKSGADFYPGWHEGQYQPQSFRLGAWISLCALFLCAFVGALRNLKKEKLSSPHSFSSGIPKQEQGEV